MSTGLMRKRERKWEAWDILGFLFFTFYFLFFFTFEVNLGLRVKNLSILLMTLSIGWVSLSQICFLLPPFPFTGHRVVKITDKSFLFYILLFP